MKNGPYELVVAPTEYPGMKYRGRYAYEHHVVWWQHTGETIGPGEEIHHKNEKKRDNRFKNLEKLTGQKHRTMHRPPQPWVTVACAGCTGEVSRPAHRFRESKKRGVTRFFCTKSCKGRYDRAHSWKPRRSSISIDMK